MDAALEPYKPMPGVDQTLARHEERIFIPAELRTKPIVECNEPLTIIQRQLPNLICRNILPDTVEVLGSELMLCRAGVLERLREASESIKRCAASGLLPEGSQLIVGYAYRAPEVQEKYFEMAKAHALGKNSKLTPEQVEAEASKIVNAPDVAGHIAGAALDVTIADKNGIELNMGSPSLSLKYETLIPVFAFKDLNAEIHDRRLMLRDAMTSAGFAPFAGEWWHFSFGDRDWAFYYGKPCAIYGATSSAAAKEIIKELSAN